MELKCDVKAYYGVLGTKKDKTGRIQEIRLCKVSWGGSAPKWDLRAWTEDEKPAKGLTLTDDMMIELKSILDTVDLEKTS